MTRKMVKEDLREILENDVIDFDFIGEEETIVKVWKNKKLYDTYTLKDFENAAVELGSICVDEDEEFPDIDNSINYFYAGEEKYKYICIYATWASGQGGVMVLWDIITKKPLVSSPIEYVEGIYILPKKKIIFEGIMVQNFVTPLELLVSAYTFNKFVSEEEKTLLNINWDLSLEEINKIELLREKKETGNIFEVHDLDENYYFVLGNSYGSISKKELYEKVIL